jgi:hypothetical protein
MAAAIGIDEGAGTVGFLGEYFGRQTSDVVELDRSFQSVNAHFGSACCDDAFEYGNWVRSDDKLKLPSRLRRRRKVQRAGARDNP